MTLTLDAVPAGEDLLVKATVWGMGAGRYGSLVSAVYRVEQTDLPRDPEELVSLLLSSASHLTYHS